MDEKKIIAHHLFKKTTKNKKKLLDKANILSKLEMGHHDIVEQKGILLNNIKNNIKKIKKETIKEFVYSNKTIPALWKNKKNFQDIVLETFAEDNNFLKYLGNVGDNDSIPVKSKTQIRPKTVSSDRRNIKKNFQINKNNYNKTKNILLGKLESIKSEAKSDTTNIYSSTFSKNINKPKIKLRKIISPQEEMQNIFDNLKVEYPILKKLEELYPNYDWGKMSINVPNSNDSKNSDNNKIENLNSIESLIDKSRLHKIDKIQRNIFNNLLSLKKNKKLKFCEYLGENSNNYKAHQKIHKGFSFNNIKSKNKKEIIKNELNDSTIFNHLKSMNFYGPYFSYCPYCCGNNIKYYKHMEKKQCISLLNFIKLDRSKKLQIEESKFREKIRMSKYSFSK